MSTFKVGDRVAVYGPTSTGTFLVGADGTVVMVRDEDCVDVRLQSGHTWAFHPKQCRRLKKKKRPEEYWVRTCVGSEDMLMVPAIMLKPIPNCRNCQVFRVRRIKEAP